MTKLESKKLVVKDNRLINAKYDLSLQEQRLILWLISEIGPNDTDFQEYRIYISDLASFIGIENSHTIYDQMRAITKRLMTRVVELESVDGNMVLQAHWVDTAIYNKKSGCIDVRLSKELRPYLLEIKRNFTKYELKHAITMKSAHAIRIYELLKQYERIGTRFLPIEEIRRECGISPDQYDKYKDLRVRVVDISVREINDRSDIYIEYDEIKDGRKVIAINFKISKNKGAVLPDPIMDDPSTARHVFRLADYGITREKAQELVQKHSIEIIAWALGEISRRIKSKDKADAIDNPAGWIIKAIEEDWRPQRSLFNEEREQNNTKRVAEIEVNRKRKERISEIEPIITKIRNDYHTYVNSTICAVIDGMKRDDRITIERDFEAYLKKQNGAFAFASRFDGGGGRSWIADAMVRQHAVKYLSDYCPDFIIYQQSAYAKRHDIENFEELEREYKELIK